MPKASLVSSQPKGNSNRQRLLSLPLHMPTCSKPPSSSVVSMSLAMGNSSSWCPVNCARARARLDFPTRDMPTCKQSKSVSNNEHYTVVATVHTNIVIQCMSTDCARVFRGFSQWCNKQYVSLVFVYCPVRCNSVIPIYTNQTDDQLVCWTSQPSALSPTTALSWQMTWHTNLEGLWCNSEITLWIAWPITKHFSSKSNNLNR